MDRTLRRQIDTLFNLGVIQELTDGQLLERFATDSGELDELAFAALVERHGAMVLRVCRAQLRDIHDSQDAFQATFMILIKRARTLWIHDSLGPWLHQVAFRTASCARASIARRRRLEHQAADCDRSETQSDFDLEHVLHEEINRLPERYRIPIVLCDLEGHSCEEAARRMGRPVGTIKSLRSRGRDRLRNRMTRLGIAPSAGLAAVLSTHTAVGATVRVLTDQLMAGTVSASVFSLVNGVLKIMLLSKLRMTAVTLLGLFALAAGFEAVTQAWAQDAKPQGPAPATIPNSNTGHANPSPLKEEDSVWRLSLAEAIRIGLRNSKTVRELKSGSDGVFTITPEGRNKDVYVFKSEVMAHVRSVSQQYWSLHSLLVEHAASEKAVDLGEQILLREQAKFKAGSDTLPNITEAQAQLERFKLDVVDKTSALIITERQLRNILGLPPTEGRRIVPSTKPLETELKPDWAESNKAMIENQPDIMSSKFLSDSMDRTKVDPVQVKRQEDFHQQVIHQTTHSLARFILEVDSNYKLFETAGRLKATAKQRLDTQTVFFENGTITIDRYLDAVNPWSSAVAQEARFRAQYNSAITALEEVKGTLLAHEQIVVVEPPKVFRASGQDLAIQPASLNLQPQPKPVPLPVVIDPKTDTAGKTYSFQFRIGSGPTPLEIRGSFTVAPTQTTDTAKGR